MKLTKLPNGGELHEYCNSDKCWYRYGKLHREDGPALEWADGYKYWCIDGKCHREDGPAIEYANGNKWWFLNDIQIFCKTQKEFERLMRLKAFW